MIIDTPLLTITCPKCDRRLDVNLDAPDLSTREQHKRMLKMHERCPCGALTEATLTQKTKTEDVPDYEATASLHDATVDDEFMAANAARPPGQKAFVKPMGRLMEMTDPASMRSWAFLQIATALGAHPNEETRSSAYAGLGILMAQASGI